MKPIHSIATAVNHLNPHRIPFEIEDFVEEIMHADQRGVLRSTQSELYFYMHLLGHLPRYLSAYIPSDDYTALMDAFWVGCDAAGLLPKQTQFGDLRYSMELLNRESVVLLVESIAHYTKTPRFKRRSYDDRYQTKKNRKSLDTYMNWVLRRYSNTLVVRIDLWYLKENLHLISAHDAFRDRNAFLSLISKHNVFDHLIGFAWAMEQGRDRGYHTHFVFCFNGSERRNGSGIGNLIGKLWSKLTVGKGWYFNCNSWEHVEKFERAGKRGVGRIYRNNPTELENARRTLSYLAEPEKEGQHIRIRPGGARAFSKGQTKWLAAGY